MVQIFISHSSKDREIKNFFNQCFAQSKVKPIFEEYDIDFHHNSTPIKIKRDIELSNAIFVLLSENTKNLTQTREWIAWEMGVGANKDIWVFIPVKIQYEIRMLIPRLSRLVLYNFSDDSLDYIHRIIESYNIIESVAISAASAGVEDVLGTIVPEEIEQRGEAAIAGGLLGGAMYGSSSKIQLPPGKEMRCTMCGDAYTVHAAVKTFRCPVCGVHLDL